MANDPWFNKVASLLPLDDVAADGDPNLGYLIAAWNCESFVAEIGGAITTTGAITLTTKAGKKAAYMPAASYLTWPITPTNTQNAITVEMDVWLGTASTSYAGGGICAGLNGGGSTSTSAMIYDGKAAGSAAGVYFSTNVLTLGAWHRLSISYGGNNKSFRIFVDGVLVSTTPNVAPSLSTLSYAFLGGPILNAAVYIANFRVYSRELFTASYTPTNRRIAYNGADVVSTKEWREGGTPVLSAAQSKFGGKSLSLNGASYLFNSGYSLAGSDFAIEMWVRVSSFANSPIIASQWATPLPYGWFWYISSDGYMTLYVSASSHTVGYAVVLADRKMLLNTWHHVAMVRLGNRLALLQDGAVVGHLYFTGILKSGVFAIGTHSTSLNSGSAMNGYIDDFRMTIGSSRYAITLNDPYYDNTIASQPFRNSGADWYNPRYRDRVLTPAAAAVGIAVTDPFGNAGQAAYFDGTSLSTQKFTAHADFDFTTGDFTIEAWVYIDAVSSGALLSSGVATWGTGGHAFYVTDSNIRFASYGNGDPVVTANVTLLGGWHHVALVRASGMAYLFSDGILRASAACASAVDFGNSSNGTLIGGTGWSTTQRMIGKVADLRVTKGIGRYTANYPVPTAYYAPLGGSFSAPAEANALAITTISGIVMDSGGNPVQRQVFAYSHATGRYLGGALSDAVTGIFSVAVPERAFVVALDDDVSARNAIVYDRLDPV